MSRLFRVTLIILLIIGAPVMLFFLGSNILSSWVGGAVGFVLGPLYLALVLWLLSRSPMWPERSGAGWKWIVSCLMWGGGVSLTLVMSGGLALQEITDRLGLRLISASLGGAYPEEIAKALGVGVLLFTFRSLNRPWHGLLTGALIGLGFEVVENMMYGSFGAMLDPNTDLAGTLDVWQLRLFVGPALHIVLSAFAGWGLGLALFTAGKSSAWRWATAGGWLFVAFALHFAWNLLWPREWMFIVNYIVVALIMYPLIIRVWITAHRAAKADTSYAYTPAPVTAVPR